MKKFYKNRIGIAVFYWVFPIDATITKCFKNKSGKACGFKLEKDLHEEGFFHSKLIYLIKLYNI